MKRPRPCVGWLGSEGHTGQIERYDAPDQRVQRRKRPNVVATIQGLGSDSGAACGS